MKKLFFLTTAIYFLFSCGSTKVTRIDTNTQTDLSGRWNDVDAQMISKDMVDQMLEGNWMRNYKLNNDNKKPVVIVGDIQNKTSEHISTSVFTKEMEKAGINSGTVDFVASSSERQEIRQERIEQQSNASMETMKQIGNEVGADFILKGEISSIEDAVDGQKIIYYQVNLELIDIETNKKTWMGSKKIKKFIGRDKWKP